MTKRPSKSEFLEKYNSHDSKDVASEKIAEEYNVKQETVKRWIEKYVNELTSNMNDKSDLEDKYEFEFFRTIKDKYSDINPRLDSNYRHAEIKMKEPKGGGILVVCLSDTHIGSAFTDLQRLAEDANLIKETDGVYAIFAGDVIDFGPISASPRSLLHDQLMTFGRQKQLARLLFRAIGHKILALTSGCHGAWLYNETGEFFEEELAEMTITNAFLLHGGTIDLTLGNQTYSIFVSHKVGGNSKLNPTRGLFKLHEQGLDFDIGIAAHHHTPNMHTMMRRGKPVACIKCGTYKMLDTFANKLGFVQSPLTIPGFYISSEKRAIVPFLDWRDGIKML